MCLAVAAVNQAVKEQRVKQTLRVLSLPEVALQGLLPDCAADYQRALSALIAHRKDTGKSLLMVAAIRSPHKQLIGPCVFRRQQESVGSSPAAGWILLLLSPEQTGGTLGHP